MAFLLEHKNSWLKQYSCKWIFDKCNRNLFFSLIKYLTELNMKRFIVFLPLMVFISFGSFAKKDINAWKQEKNLNQQYEVFKENLKYWNGSYFMNETQLDQFYRALKDSVEVWESKVAEVNNQRASIANELNVTLDELETTNTKLSESIKHQNSILVFGAYMNKSAYTLIVYSIIVGLLVLIGFLFLMNKRSQSIASSTKKEFNELKEEFEIHKKNSLERYTKINTELHQTRLKLNKKLPFQNL